MKASVKLAFECMFEDVPEEVTSGISHAVQ